jgi:hypothetical protein
MCGDFVSTAMLIVGAMVIWFMITPWPAALIPVLIGGTVLYATFNVSAGFNAADVNRRRKR